MESFGRQHFPKGAFLFSDSASSISIVSPLRATNLSAQIETSIGCFCCIEINDHVF
jgi:hypothetical protein